MSTQHNTGGLWQHFVVGNNRTLDRPVDTRTGARTPVRVKQQEVVRKIQRLFSAAQRADPFVACINELDLTDNGPMSASELGQAYWVLSLAISTSTRQVYQLSSDTFATPSGKAENEAVHWATLIVTAALNSDGPNLNALINSALARIVATDNEGHLGEAIMGALISSLIGVVVAVRDQQQQAP